MTETKSKAKRGRPAKSGRDSAQTKNDIIRSGIEYFTQYGFASSGLDKILKNVAVPKGSFYYYFPNKETFGLTLIAEYNRYFIKKLDNHLLNEAHSPLCRLHNFIADAREGMQKHQFNRGCLVGNLEQQSTIIPESHRLEIIAILHLWQQKVAQCLALAQAQGEIKHQVDCQSYAEFFWIGWEGAISRSKLMKNAAAIDNFSRNFFAQITP